MIISHLYVVPVHCNMGRIFTFQTGRYETFPVRDVGLLMVRLEPGALGIASVNKS